MSDTVGSVSLLIIIVDIVFSLNPEAVHGDDDIAGAQLTAVRISQAHWQCA